MTTPFENSSTPHRTLFRRFSRRAEHATQDRVITPGRATAAYGDNAVTSAKYTWLNMLPKAVFDQFRRLSNFYFLIVAAISFIPNISPSTPVTTTLPLVVVIGFGLARDVYEDFKRKRADSASNNRPIVIRRRSEQSDHSLLHVRALSDSTVDFPDEPGAAISRDEHVVIRSGDLAVGDIVLIQDDEQIPADVVVLASSDPSHACYVSTANLDGESNLKRRSVPHPLRASNWILSHLDKLDATITVSAPNPSLYDFQGTLSVAGVEDPEEGITPLDTSNLLLRGSNLRNIDYAYGLVVYNGSHTKVALNMRNPPSKLGGIERMMNKVVIALFAVLLVVTVITSVVAGIWQSRYGEQQWYMGENRLLSARLVALRSLGTYIILYHTFVPVSLFVTLEFVRIFQGAFISADRHMHTRGTSVDVKANNLNESLGYVEHIFSDKTGTLTDNVMCFVGCAVSSTTLDLRKDADALQNALKGSNATKYCLLLRSITLAHDVMRKTHHSHQPGATAARYQGESVDEVALVHGAWEAGFELVDRTDGSYVVKEPGSDTQQTYTPLATLEFSSTRKRMSTVFRCPDGQLRIFSKGADSVMVERLKRDVSVEDIDATTYAFSKDGLRTLVYATRVIQEEEYNDWRVRYNEASNTLENRAAKKEAVAAELERNLEFAGVTAVEDKLQENVPQTISFLREAGLRIWVLTGDKVETAENIGYSSHLLSRDMRVMFACCANRSELHTLLKEANPNPKGNRSSSSSGWKYISGRRRKSNPNQFKLSAFEDTKDQGSAMIIDGMTLSFVQGEEMELLFLDVAMSCKTIICARVTPLQKANIVKMVRKHYNCHSLAIGDGGNDVSMIQEAHIGVGIRGKEGTQAARAADYSMGEFQHLARLLAVHGRFSYIRTSGVINLSFYKNVFFSMTQFLFQFFCFASGTTFHNQWVVTGWNSLLTLFPPFLFGLFERDLEVRSVLRLPALYKCYGGNKLFSLRTVLEYTIAYSLWHAMTVFWMTYFFFGMHMRTPMRSGVDGGFFFTALAMSAMSLCIALFKILLVSHIWTTLVLVAAVGSFALFWVLVVVVGVVIHDAGLEGVPRMLLGTVSFHLLWPLVFAFAFLPDFLVKLKRGGAENVVERVQRVERMEDKQARQAE